MRSEIKRYPFLLIAGCLVSGILLGRYAVQFPLSLWLSIFFLLCAIISKWVKRTNVRIMCLIFALSSAATFRYHLAAEILPENHLIQVPGEKVSCFEGMIADYQYKIDFRDKYVLDHVKICGEIQKQLVSGKILIFAKNIRNRFRYGDRVRIYANLNKPERQHNPGQFDYRAYLFSKDIYYTCRISDHDSVSLIARDQGNLFIQQIIIPLRQYCRKTFIGFLDRDTAALLMALILGEKQDLDSQVVESFQRVGVVHVLAISGLHVGFIISFVFAVLSLLRLKYNSRIWSLIIVLIIYIILVRFKTPVIRASTMAVLYMIGQLLERKSCAYNIIFAAISLILLIDPQDLFRPGFQFSFMAVFSIVYGYEKLNQGFPLAKFLNKRWGNNRWVSYLTKWMWLPSLVSLSAVIGTLPLTLYYYGLFPVYALIANLIVIPLTGVIVFLSIFILLVAFLSPFFAAGIAHIIMVVDQGLQLLVYTISKLPYASFTTVTPSMIQIVALYFFVYLILNIKQNKLNIYLLFPAVVLIIFIFTTKSEQKKDLKIAFLDVGQGDAAFIFFPNGKTMLIDGGNSSLYWDQGAKTVLPFMQFSDVLHLNYLVGSHAHNDHIGGFPYLLETVTIDTIVLNAYQYKSRLFNTIQNLAEIKNIPIKTVFRGDQLYPDPSCRVYVLHPDSQFVQSETYNGAECNNSSLVLKIQYGKNSVLFAGDLEKEGEKPTLDYEHFLECEILKVGHHGSVTSTSEHFLFQVNPLLAVISVGVNNKFNHPSPQTISRLRSAGIRTYLTRQQGALLFRIGPEKITKLAWR
jgi:competence protein ComEC